MEDITAFNNGQPVEHALVLLNRAIAILDSENLAIAAAKVDEARCALRRANARMDALCPSEPFPEVVR